MRPYRLEVLLEIPSYQGGDKRQTAVFFLQRSLLAMFRVVKVCRKRPSDSWGVERDAPGTGHDRPRSVP